MLAILCKDLAVLLYQSLSVKSKNSKASKAKTIVSKLFHVSAENFFRTSLECFIRRFYFYQLAPITKPFLLIKIFPVLDVKSRTEAENCVYKGIEYNMI